MSRDPWRHDVTIRHHLATRKDNSKTFLYICLKTCKRHGSKSYFGSQSKCVICVAWYIHGYRRRIKTKPHLLLHIFHDTSLADPAWKPLRLRGRGFHAGRLVKYHGKYATAMWFCFIISTSAGLLSIGPLVTNFNAILNKISNFHPFIHLFFHSFIHENASANFVSEMAAILSRGRRDKLFPYPEPVVFQWQSSGNPVCLELRPQCTLECHWRNASVLPVVFQWSSSGFPVVFQCVPIMQINTGSPLGHHWVLVSASVVPVASQCTCGSSGLPVCSNYAN